MFSISNHLTTNQDLPKTLKKSTHLSMAPSSINNRNSIPST